MRRYLSRVLRNRFTSSREQQDTDKPTARKRNVMDLALESYNKEQKASTGQLQQQSKLDPDFEKYAIDAMNAFIFGGKQPPPVEFGASSDLVLQVMTQQRRLSPMHFTTSVKTLVQQQQ